MARYGHCSLLILPLEARATSDVVAEPSINAQICAWKVMCCLGESTGTTHALRGGSAFCTDCISTKMNPPRKNGTLTSSCDVEKRATHIFTERCGTGSNTYWSSGPEFTGQAMRIRDHMHNVESSYAFRQVLPLVLRAQYASLVQDRAQL